MIKMEENGETIEEQKIKKTFGIKLKENTYTRINYEFVGWCENAEGEGEIYQSGSYYKPNKDTTLYAIWRKNAVTITFEANAGTDEVTGQMEEISVAENKDTKLPQSTLKREEYYFINWNTKADGTGTTYENGGTIKISEDITLFAQWGVKVKSISVKNLTVLKGKSGQLEVTKTPNNALVEGLTYTSSNPNIATVDGNGKVTGISKGTVTITVIGKISTNIKGTCTVTVQQTELEASDIKKSPNSYYGSIVTGYTAGTGVTTWRIFYADNTNIYLIADDYISRNDVPNSPSGAVINSRSEYQLQFTNVSSDTVYSTGSAWISGNSKAKKWLNKYLTNFPNSTEAHIKAVAYMMDTNIWNKYANNNLADYAIGAPTIEMFCSSYKDTHPNRYVEYEAMKRLPNYDYIGYGIKWSDATSWNTNVDIPKSDEFNSIYYKSDNSKAYGMWIASPSFYVNSTLIQTYWNGSALNSGEYSTSQCGLRPIVCLKSTVQLEKKSEGIYAIK